MDLKSFIPDKISTPAKMFLAASFINGFANGMNNVVYLLYLTSLGFQSTDLSSIIMMSPIALFTLMVPSGILAGRLGSKKMMILLLIPWTLFSIIILIADSVPMFMLASLLIGSVDAIANVILGPLYASFFDVEDMDKAFSLQMSLNILTLSLGSLIGFFPPILVANYGYTYRSAYWFIIFLSVILFFLQIPFYLYAVWKCPEITQTEKGFKINIKSKSVVIKVAFLNFLSSIGFSSFFSLFPYYVNKKFGIQSDALGSLYFISNFIRVGASLSASKLSTKFGTLKTIAVSILACVPFYFLIPLSQDFIWLSIFYTLRLFIGNISSPLTGSLLMKLLYSEERPTANSFTAMAAQGGNVIGPIIGGCLMEQVSLDAPAYLGSTLYILLGGSYYLLLKDESIKQQEKPI